MSLEKILTLPWMKAADKDLSSEALAGAVVQLKRFNARRRLKKTMQMVRSTVRMKLLLAARVQKVLDATAEKEGTPAANPDEPMDKAVARALAVASSKGILSPAEIRAQAEAEQHERLLAHLEKSAAAHKAVAAPAAAGRPAQPNNAAAIGVVRRRVG